MAPPYWIDILLSKVKSNLILEPFADAPMLENYIQSALSYAEDYQHKPRGTYTKERYTKRRPKMTDATEQAVIMLSTHFYESRDGSTGGFFSDSPAAGREVWEAVHRLLRTDKDWSV